MPKSRSRRRPAPRRPAQQRPQAAPPRPAAAAPGRRGAIERRSAPVLLWLSTRPKLLLPAVSLALLIGGLAAPRPLGVPLLLLLFAVVGWLVYLSWPVVHGGARVVRLATLGLLLAAAVLRIAQG